ncbi:MAG TPA: serine hydrolase domain-containing protein [Myxococcales bacterium]
MHRYPRSFVLLLVAAGCAAASPVARRPEVVRKFAEARPASAAPAELLAPKLEAALPKIEAAAQEEFAKGALPNLVVGLVADGRLVWSKGFGRRDPAESEPPDSRSLFRIGSITKIVTGASLLMLRDQGKLSLDDPAALYVPELGEVLYPSRDCPPITLRHLVTHTSGLPRVGKLDYARSDRDLAEADVVAALAGAKLEFVPGTKTSYSNLAMAVAGLVVARVSGMPYERFVQERLFAPLGIAHAVFQGSAADPAHLAAGHKGSLAPYQPVPTSAHWRLGVGNPMGGLYLDLEDFARLAAFEMSAWPPRDEADAGPLSRASLRESQMPAAYGLGSPTFGVNWGVLEDSKLGHLVTHTGSTEDYSASIRLQPRRGLGALVMTGCGDADRASALAKAILSLAFDAAPPPAPALSPAFETVLGRVRKLLEAPDVAGIEGAFSPKFLESVPKEKLLALFKQVQQVGACTEHTVLVSEEGKAVVKLKCEKASLEIAMHAPAEPPHLLEGFYIKDAK